MKTNKIRLVAVSLCLLLGTLSMQAARLKGIRIESERGSVVVYLNGEQVCTPSGSCFIANLTNGYYQIRVYEARFSGHEEQDRRAGLLLDERVYYSGSGIKEIRVQGNLTNDPSRPIRPSRPSRPSPPGGDAAYGEVMSRDTFEAFYRAFKGANFDSERTNLIETALLTSLFTSVQCRRLVDVYTFDSERTRVMQQLYPRVADKENFFVVIEGLTHQMSKNEMNSFLKKYHGARN